jgi:hypothetical protein
MVGAVEQAAGRVDGLAEAIDERIVELHGERLVFTHPLLASVAYHSAPPWQRREAHRRLAQGAIDLVERARHLALATDSADEAVAAALDEAAAQAASRGAPETAAELSDHALRLTDPASEAVVEGLVRSASFHFTAGDAARSRERLEEASSLPVSGTQRAQIHWRLGQVTYMADNVPAANALFRQALDEASDDLSLRAHIEQALAFTAPLTGEVLAGVAPARAAHELAQQLDDPAALSISLARAGANDFLAGQRLDGRDRVPRRLDYMGSGVVRLLMLSASLSSLKP